MNKEKFKTYLVEVEIPDDNNCWNCFYWSSLSDGEHLCEQLFGIEFERDSEGNLTFEKPKSCKEFFSKNREIRKKN